MAIPPIDRFALIIGAMKSGTTTLFERLGAHPEVAPSRPKEPDFFSRNWQQAGSLDEYRNLWSWDPARHSVALEGSTSYTMLPRERGIVERIRTLERTAPREVDLKFIYVMRDPIQRIASQLSHVATRRAGKDRLREEDFAHAIQVSRYAMQLDPYRLRWSGEAILPLLYETLVADPEGTLLRVQDFLGLQPAPSEPERASVARNTRTDLAADQILSVVLDRAPWLDPLRRWIPASVLRGVRRAVGTVGARTVELTETQKRRAIQMMRPEVARIESEWGLDTTPWKSLR